nr:cytochrome P450 [Agasicles hygrophila]
MLTGNIPLSYVKMENENLGLTILSVICIAMVIIWYLKYLWYRRYMYYYSSKIPGPFSLPFIGIGFQMLFSGETSDIMGILLKFQKAYPDLCKIWFGPKLYIAVSNPEHIEKVLNSPKALDKDYLYKFLSFAIGEGLITARGQKWKKHRKAIMPAFNQKILDNYQKVFAQKSAIFTNILLENSGNKELDLAALLANCTLDMICETALGLDMDMQKTNMDFFMNLDKLMEITCLRIFKVWHHLTFTFPLFPISKEYVKCLNTFLNFTSAIIKKKLDVFNSNLPRKGSLTIEDKNIKEKENLAFLDLIMENSNFTEEELREEVNLFLIAGTDTTASALACTFVMLGMHQDVQEKVLEEILETMGPDRPVLPSDLPHLVYTERVIKESLRLFPVAAFFLRKIAEDIQVGDVVFPAGSSVYFGSVHIMRNPKYWPDPLKFDPDRFLPENVAKRHPCTYIPFSYGPRKCIGGRYAIMNMKTVLASVLRKVRIFTEYKTVKEIKLKTNIVLRMKDGPKVWVEKR